MRTISVFSDHKPLATLPGKRPNPPALRCRFHLCGERPWRIWFGCLGREGGASRQRGQCGLRQVNSSSGCRVLLQSKTDQRQCPHSNDAPTEKAGHHGPAFPHNRQADYLSSTSAPAASSLALISSASAFGAPSLTALPPASTRSLASFRPRPVIAADFLDHVDLLRHPPT